MMALPHLPSKNPKTPIPVPCQPPMVRLLLAACVVGAWSCDSKSPAIMEFAAAVEQVPVALPEAVTFNAHIRPILSDKCFSCHGFDAKTREADLRLDTAEGAYAPLADQKDKRAIIPGDSKNSEVWRRITTTDEDLIMPVPDFHKPLSPREIQLITAWIDQGAEYQEHWSFSPIVKSSVPEVDGAGDMIANPIDALVISQLRDRKIEPSPIADKATLLRRLSLDLIGLPPTSRELEAFLADESPDAYAKQVERLLASPHYGERMAVPWLDAVRFADTVGYHGDQNARVFPYRDYVIQSFNSNKPFDQFTIEQLAGDLLPNPTDEQRVATGFLRLNLMTREGGAQPKEYMAKYMGDRVRAVGTAWLGLTTGCAECHDHKFDPVTAKDFYSLGAFFADVRQWGVYADYKYTPNPDLPKVNNDWPFPPEIQAANGSQKHRLAKLRAELVRVAAASGGNAEADDAWAASAAAFLQDNPSGWQPLAAEEITSQLATPYRVLPDQSVLFTGEAKEGDVITLRLPLPAAGIAAIRFEALPDAENAGKVGRRGDGKFAVTPKFTVDGQDLKIAYAQADRRTPQQYKNGEHQPLLEAEWHSAPALWEEPQDGASRPHHAVNRLEQPLPIAEGRFLMVTLASADIGKVRFSITPFAEPVPGESDALTPDLKAALLAATIPRSEEQRQQVTGARYLATTAYSVLSQDSQRLIAAIQNCRAGYAHSVVAQPLPAGQIPTTHLLPRGNWMTPAAEVKPAVPAFLPHESVPANADRLTRLDLAKWLVAKENPLTARHFTNRLWKQFFGKGLSNVLDDLGNQGEWPSNPALLDWLAAEFRDSGWDVKHIVRLIVTSRTYRQESGERADLVEADPANRLLAAQSPRRLDAEFVRDNILAVSGLLSDDIVGGPSVKPYQPAGYYANLNFPQRDYPASMDDGQYRRGVYMHWQRTFMHPMLAGFDAPSREECAADRLQSNSPQQALILLNDPSFVEAARAFATSLLAEAADAKDGERIRKAILRTVSREPRKGEAESLEAFLHSQRIAYKSVPEDAKALLKVGNSTLGSDLDPIELAAWTQTCRVLLNLHETITRF